MRTDILVVVTSIVMLIVICIAIVIITVILFIICVCKGVSAASSNWFKEEDPAVLAGDPF